MNGSDNYLHLFDFEFKRNAKISWQELQTDGDYCDVTLACEDKQIKAHRLVISSFSPVLRNILKQNQAPNPLIYLTRVCFRNLQNLLSFMYQGEVEVTKEDLTSFLAVAENLNVKGLCENNTDHFDSNEADPSQYTYKNIHPTTKSKRNDDIVIDPIFNEIDSKTLFTPETNVRIVTSPLGTDKAKQNIISTVPVERQNRISIVVQDEKRCHPCGQCNYRATQKFDLKRHIRSIHLGERYPCDQCTYKATLTYNLKEHIKTIHEGKRYTCGMCDYNGADRSGLRKHKLRKHNL